MSDLEPTHDSDIPSEEISIGELFDLMLIAQNHLEAYGDPELTLSTFQQEIREIYGLCDGKSITATGDKLFLPAIEESGDTTSTSVSSGVVTGVFDTITVGYLPEYNDELPKPLIGVRLHLGSCELSYVTVEKILNFFAFVPFEGSTFNIQEDGSDIIEPDDNEVKSLIDAAMANFPTDLQNLSKIFEDVIQPCIDDDGDRVVGLQHDVYLNYLNQIVTFQSITAIAEYGIQRMDEGAVVYQDDDKTYTLYGEFYKFEMFSSNLGGESMMKLMITAIDEDGDPVGVIVDTISEIELR